VAGGARRSCFRGPFAPSADQRLQGTRRQPHAMIATMGEMGGTPAHFPSRIVSRTDGRHATEPHR